MDNLSKDHKNRDTFTIRLHYTIIRPLCCVVEGRGKTKTCLLVSVASVRADRILLLTGS